MAENNETNPKSIELSFTQGDRKLTAVQPFSVLNEQTTPILNKQKSIKNTKVLKPSPKSKHTSPNIPASLSKSSKSLLPRKCLSSTADRQIKSENESSINDVVVEAYSASDIHSATNIILSTRNLEVEKKRQSTFGPLGGKQNFESEKEHCKDIEKSSVFCHETNQKITAQAINPNTKLLSKNTYGKKTNMPVVKDESPSTDEPQESSLVKEATTRYKAGVQYNKELLEHQYLSVHHTISNPPSPQHLSSSSSTIISSPNVVGRATKNRKSSTYTKLSTSSASPLSTVSGSPYSQRVLQQRHQRGPSKSKFLNVQDSSSSNTNNVTPVKKTFSYQNANRLSPTVEKFGQMKEILAQKYGSASLNDSNLTKKSSRVKDVSLKVIQSLGGKAGGEDVIGVASRMSSWTSTPVDNTCVSMCVGSKEPTKRSLDFTENDRKTTTTVHTPVLLQGSRLADLKKHLEKTDRKARKLQQDMQEQLLTDSSSESLHIKTVSISPSSMRSMETANKDTDNDVVVSSFSSPKEISQQLATTCTSCEKLSLKMNQLEEAFSQTSNGMQEQAKKSEVQVGFLQAEIQSMHDLWSKDIESRIQTHMKEHLLLREEHTNHVKMLEEEHIQELQRANETSRTTLNEKQQQLIALESKYTALEVELNTVRGQYTKADEERVQLLTLQQEHDMEIEKRRAMVEKTLQMNDILKQEITELKRRLEEITQQRHEMEMALEEETARGVKWRNQLQEEHQKEKELYMESIKQEQHNHYKRERDNFEQKIIDLETRAESAELSLLETQELLKCEKNKTLCEAQAAVQRGTDLAERCEEYREKLALMTTRCERLQNDKENLRDQLSSAQSLRTLSMTEIETITVDRDQAAEQISQLKQKLECQKQEVHCKQKQVEDLQAQIVQQNNTLEQVHAQTQHLTLLHEETKEKLLLLQQKDMVHKETKDASTQCEVETTTTSTVTSRKMSLVVWMLLGPLFVMFLLFQSSGGQSVLLQDMSRVPT